MLKTVRLTAPLASGQEYAEMLGQLAMVMGGGQPLMQRVGDFRLGKRSRAESFTGDLYDFEPTLKSCTPGDVSLAMPAKILRAIWKSMKLLDTIVPGVLHPSTVMYWPEIKLYANRPRFIDDTLPGRAGHLADRRRCGHQPGHHGRLGERHPGRARHRGLAVSGSPENERGPSREGPRLPPIRVEPMTRGFSVHCSTT